MEATDAKLYKLGVYMSMSIASNIRGRGRGRGGTSSIPTLSRHEFMQKMESNDALVYKLKTEMAVVRQCLKEAEDRERSQSLPPGKRILKIR